MVPHLIGRLSHWSPNWHPRITHSIGSPPPLSLPPSLRLIGPPQSHWSLLTGWAPNSEVPTALFEVIGPPTLHFLPCSYWPPSHWYPIVTLSTLFSLVLHPIGPPILPFLPCAHWSPDVTLAKQFSLVPRLIGPPNATLVMQFSLVPISLVPQSSPVYPVVLIGSPSHWSPSVILVTQLSLVPHLFAPPPPL